MPIRVEVPGQGIVEFPDGMSNSQIEDAIKRNQPQQESGTLKNLGLGALRGVGGIGASLAQPVQALAGGFLGNNAEMRQNMEDNLSRFGANKDTLAYQGGKLGAEIAGTYGVGGLAGRALSSVSQAPKALALAEALKTGGMAKGVGTGMNIAGGAGNAALGTLLVDPENTLEGAAIGAAIPAAGAAIPAVGNALANAIGGVGTHTGGESIKTAARSGMEGGQSGAAFIDNLRGNVPMTDVLDKAKAGLAQIGADRAQAYREGMKGVTADKSILSFNGIDDAIKNALGKVSYGGQVTNQKGAEVAQELADAVRNWKGLNPEQFHTAEGLDALKRSVSGTVESIPFEQNTARQVGGDVYNAIKREISSQAPDYAKTMKEYSDASELIGEMQRALSLGKGASTDTSMRKLQSVMRNNVNTNYGNRLDLARALEENGGVEIMPSLAGQALNSWTPRGLGNVAVGATGLAGAAINPSILGALLFQSPRLVGEGAYLTGKAAKGVSKGAEKISPATAALINALNGD
jgi:hypothetical protein